MSPFDGVNDAENDQIPAVSMQVQYLFLLVQNLHSCVQTCVLSGKSAADIVRFVPKKESNRVLDNTKKAQNRMPTCTNVRRLRANNAQKMSQIGAGFTLFQTILGWFLHIFHPLIPSNSTSLTASISTRWSKVVSRPYFNKKKRHLSLSLAHACIYTIYNTLTFSARF